jgi:hypothetical protein
VEVLEIDDVEDDVIDGFRVTLEVIDTESETDTDADGDAELEELIVFEIL